MAVCTTNTSMPNFVNDCSLCKQVESKLGSDSVKCHYKKELIETSGHLHEAIQRYFKCYMIVKNVERFLENKTLSDNQTASTAEQKSNKEEIYSDSHPLYLNFIKKYLPSESTNGIELFGISRDFVDKVLQSKQKSELEKEELNKYVEKEIEEFCMKINSYAGFGFKYKHNWRRAFKEAMQELNLEYNYLTMADIQIKRDEAAIKDMRSDYYQELSNGICILKKLASLYKKKIDFELLLEEYYTKKGDAFNSKIRRFELEILKSTYYNQSIQALNIIRDQLNKRKEQLDQLYNETKMSIQYYYVLGPQYAQVAKQYAELCAKIGEQKWALESLKNRSSQSDSIIETGKGDDSKLEVVQTDDEVNNESLLV